jgi:transcriptional regulator with XRE-family HTH domain
MFTWKSEATYPTARSFPNENTCPCEVFTIVSTPSERLRLFIKAEFKTQRAFAAAVEIPESQVSDYLNDRVEIGRAALMKFGKVGLNTHWLLFGTGTMKVDPDAVEPTERDKMLDDIADEIAERVAIRIYSQSEWGKKMRRQIDDEEREVNGEEEPVE